MNQIVVIQNAYECNAFLTFFPSHISHFAIYFSNSLPTMHFAENQLNIKWKKRSLQGCLGKSYFINGARKVYNPLCQIVGLYQMKKQSLECGFRVACCRIIRASEKMNADNIWMRNIKFLVTPPSSYTNFFQFFHQNPCPLPDLQVKCFLIDSQFQLTCV